MPIERFDRDEGKVVAATNQPTIVSWERVYLVCGCCCWVGFRIDTLEPATASTNCSPKHREMMESFLDLFRKSLDDPQPCPAVEIALELLEKCEEEEEAKNGEN